MSTNNQLDKRIDKLYRRLNNLHTKYMNSDFSTPYSRDKAMQVQAQYLFYTKELEKLLPSSF